MEKPKKPALRRRETTAAAGGARDVKKMSSSLNVSSSSLRSSSSELDHLGRESYGAAPHGAAGRRPAATVRFAPTPTTLSSSSAAAARRAGSSSHVVSSSSSQLQRAGAGVARPATARPASVSGPRARTSAGRSGSLRGGGSPELGPKGLRRSWGWGTGGGGDVEEKASVDHRRPRDDTIAVGEIKSQARSNSVTRKSPTDQEKQQQKRESKTKITSKTMASSVSPPKSAGDVSMERRSPSSTAATRKTTDKAPSSVSHMNNMVRASPPPRKTTLATMGASWESLPPDLQSIGLEVMCYRDAAEVAAVEALQEASSAEILLRCLSAFADLAAVAAEQSPQQTVDEFLALQATMARSSA
uniref:DUF6857 domain-containing protein n=1 Tax=Oryza brachyantha TaxID=4533 RepID=J3N7D2_ORYBR